MAPIDVPYIILCGPPGAGKSSTALWISNFLNTLWWWRVTTRERRPGDRDWQEYYHTSKEGFLSLLRAGYILGWEGTLGYTVNPDGSEYYRGIPHPDALPLPIAGTEVILSVYGPEGAKLIKQLLFPDALLVYLAVSPEVALDRLIERFGRDDISLHRDRVSKWSNLYEEFNNVILTDNFSVEEVALRVLHLADLKVKR